MKSDFIREKFLNYFCRHQHQIVPSSSLVPFNDATLLFTNSGMVQFKDVFLGYEQKPYTRAASSQRCIRAGGKHNDLENVGFTARHHTFFEMLGNFSFGDYFKLEAIEFAWDFLTNELGIPPEKLWVTVYKNDTEARDIWLKHIKIDANQFSLCDEKDNFWSMGDTGPCGPCSEIYYDHGPKIAGGPPGSVNQDGDRYVEIWNLVFMQFNRAANGTLTPLAKPSIDTGMGLERIAAAMQGVYSNYDTDIFKPLIEKAAHITKCQNLHDNALKVLADHIRACAFLIVDKVLPSNEGRGYVLRRIIRRAIRYGKKLGVNEPFFYLLTDVLCQTMGHIYPELIKEKEFISKILLQEEEQFSKTLDHGLRLLQQEVKKATTNIFPGEAAFKLYDTYGFPLDLTAVILKEFDYTVDYAGFDAEMIKQKTKAKAANQFVDAISVNFHDTAETTFVGYDHFEKSAKVIALLDKNNAKVELLQNNQEGVVILDISPFYAESGGQIGDTGNISAQGVFFAVEDTKKVHGVYLHKGMVRNGNISVGDVVVAAINKEKRLNIRANHSAAHLLHKALTKILNENVEQRGSYIDDQRLRFDFSYHAAISAQQINEIEQLVNEYICANVLINIKIMDIADAKKLGATALFLEKYAQDVRVVSMGDYSIELCGGIHANRTGDIGLFKIISQGAIAAGVKRIEAATGINALKLIQQKNQLITDITELLGADNTNLLVKTENLLMDKKMAEKNLASIQQKFIEINLNNTLKKIVQVNDISVLVKEIDFISDTKMLKILIDLVKNKLTKAVVIFATIIDSKIYLVANVSEEITNKLNAGEVLSGVAQKLDGKAGGKAHFAQGSANNIAILAQTLDATEKYICTKIC